MEESKESLFISRLIFIRALDILIPNGCDIFLVFENDNLDFSRIIVHNRDDIISILDASERIDLKHGDWVNMINGNMIIN